ncbi:hypothetical protein Pla175_42480 [Pirellulimonas nuda]|uniref:PEP-CTERM protein-sorting domain-containing protein n=1 Tax=Pirellulimonas nuda TaxID=2528009 RepID=A0A518DH84_9BACT|nr:hypothetical protein [Pirellulimonas nuda]QDU90835.1 hypothetical protein Pla175_42480 [Pirellulimonas nuda]
MAGVSLGQVFPVDSSNRALGNKTALYMVIRDTSDPALGATQINQIKSFESTMREFYARNSGGKLDIAYKRDASGDVVVLDIPVTLNADRTRPSNYRTTAESVAASLGYGSPSSYYAQLFDVSGTQASEGQGWAGVYCCTNDIQIQTKVTNGFYDNVLIHELGHRAGSGHASAVRSINSADYSSYVWNADAQSYETYNTATHGVQPTTFGAYSDEYGNPFDVMGNVSTGDFRAEIKKDLGWLTTAQVPNLRNLGQGTYRLYAHNELESVVGPGGQYGVVEGYDPNTLYGLTYTRSAERFITSSSSFQNYTQQVDLEYRVNSNGTGRDGVQFYIDGEIVDLDLEGGTSRNNTERELEVGGSVTDFSFGTSVFWVADTGVDFLSFSPPAPKDPLNFNNQWWEFSALSTGSDAIGHYIDLAVSLFDPLATTLLADLNQNGSLDQGDVSMFVGFWRFDTASMLESDRPQYGDFDASGLVDLSDWFFLRQSFLGAGLAAPSMAAIPEPASCTLAAGLIAFGFAARRRAKISA